MFRLLELRFARDQLVQTTFTHEIPGKTIRAVRGKTSGAFRGCGVFQWTSAVHSMSILLVECALSSRRHPGSSINPILEGQGRTPASSLDYALTKETSWLGDIFGYDLHGNLVSKRLFHRTNSGRRRPGPVSISLNPRLLTGDQIKILIDNNEIESFQALESFSTVVREQWKHKYLNQNLIGIKEAA